MRKRTFVYVGGVVIMLLILLLSLKEMSSENMLRYVVENIVSEQQEIWFGYPSVDSLYSNDKFRYFFFCKEKDTLIDKDSTLFILNKDVDWVNSIDFATNEKIYLPSSAFPFLMKKEDKSMLFRILTVKTETGSNKYKLSKMNH